MKRLNIAMLGEEQVVKQQEEPVESNLEVLGTQVEDHLIQAQQSQIEIDQIDGAVTDAEQATEELADEARAAEQATKLPQNQQQVALESIQRNVKSILKTIGLDEARGFAMESRSDDSRIALEMTVQDIKEFIKKIWDKIRETWNRIVDAIMGFLKNIFDAAARLKKRAAKIKSAAAEVDGKSIPDGVKFKAPSSVEEYMRLDHKPIPAATLDKGLKGQNKLVGYMINSLTDDKAMRRYEKVMDDVVKLNDDKLTNKDMTDVKEEELSKLSGMLVEPVVVHFTQERDNKIGTHAFISDRVITLDKTTSAIDVEKIDGFKEIKDQHDVLQPFQIKTICDIVIDQMDNYKNLDKIANNFKMFTKELSNIQSELIKDRAKDDTYFRNKARSTIASYVVKFTMGIVKSMSTKIRMIDLQVNKAAIDWCAVSVKLYTGDKTQSTDKPTPKASASSYQNNKLLLQ